MSRPRIGALRHRFALEIAQRAPDGAGGAIVTWSLVADIWSELTSATGAEIVVAENISGRVSHVVHMRHRSDVAPAMRLRSGARVLDIVAVLDVDGRGRFLECLCIEKNL